MAVKELWDCDSPELWDCDCQVAVGLWLSGSCGTVTVRGLGTVTVRELWDCDCQEYVGL